MTTDARLAELLRRHRVPATFNLNAGLHGAQRAAGWLHRGTEVRRLAQGELRAVYEGFTVANHSLTHPRLVGLPAAELRREIAEGRDRLQQIFGQAVAGFAYPFGDFDATVAAEVRAAGHVYARTTGRSGRVGHGADAMALAPSCHFLADDFWPRLARARESGGAFHFWGHSYELVDEAMWRDFEATIVRLGAEPGARWCAVHELLEEEPHA